MRADIAPFIVSEGWFNQITADGLTIYQCEFAKQQYHDRLFTTLDVPYSDTLTRAVDKRKAEFLAGRYCVKKVLNKLGVHNFTVRADKNRAPLWPVGIKGAITHSNHQALVVVTQQPDILGIGIDIEAIMDDKTMANIKDAIVKGNENFLLTRSDASPQTVTSLIFSIKESFFKAAYPSTGYYFDFDAVTINVLDFQQGRFSLTVNQDLNPQIRPGQQYDGQFTFVNGQVMSLILL